jgi:type VI secretion system protein ImpC
MAKAQQSASPAATTTTTQEGSLLDTLIGSFKPKNDEQKQQTQEFIKALISQATNAAPGSIVAGDVERTIEAWKAEIDRKISAQLNQVLHDPKFQKLEGTWRGLKYLVNESVTSETLKIKVLNVSKRTLQKDFEKASEFDQSGLFKKVYESEYGQLGGSPFGMLIGDFEFDGKSAEDVKLLTDIGRCASAAHAPFVSAASSQMFNLDSFATLNDPRDLEKIFLSNEYAYWKAFRESDDSRYVALTMPRVLARLPYGKGASEKSVDEFDYREGVDGTQHSDYTWMNAAWAYGARVTKAFVEDGWYMRTRGVEGGGVVDGLPLHLFEEAGGKTIKCPSETLIPERRENELSNLGFLPLVYYKDSDKAVFMGSQTCQKAKKFHDAAANANAELSTKLNYMLCVSRFAHCLKIMARDKVGSFAERDEMELWLNNWINNYVHPSPQNAGPEAKAKQPLAAASVTVTEVKGKPGWFQAVAHLRPHFQLEGLSTSMRLVAELPQVKK